MRRIFSIASAALLAVAGWQAWLDAQSAAPANRFPDFGVDNAPVPTPDSQLFRLSQNYPTTLPPASRKPAFMKTDFRTQPHEYLMQARDYCFEGNTPNWIVQNNKVRPWYHMPWQHWGLSGREGLHGLTKEAPVPVRALAQTQTFAEGQNYAIAFYNEFAGYAIGTVFRDAMNPSLDEFNRMGGFPEGSVTCKPLFVDIPLNQVPYLNPPLEWNAFITKGYSGYQRQTQPVYLIQLDIAVKDSRAGATKWIMGTLIYNGKMGQQDHWRNLVPVGLMWGNDPAVTGDSYTNPQPVETRINKDLKETIINTAQQNGVAELPPTHLGWNGRLDGPADNVNAACLSCHMTAEYPQYSPMNPTFMSTPTPITKGGTQWMRWFQNLPGNQPFDTGAKSTDYNLQLSGALQNFHKWKDGQDGFSVAPAPSSGAKPQAVAGGAAPAPTPARAVFPIRRQ
ncbi:MAG TPA: hypothetical protein VEF06_03555 [Bryobacteraceae bacterium]|nr:hypothetical protein [Bryobacteraceae bacterium]